MFVVKRHSDNGVHAGTFYTRQKDLKKETGQLANVALEVAEVVVDPLEGWMTILSQLSRLDNVAGAHNALQNLSRHNMPAMTFVWATDLPNARFWITIFLVANTLFW
jgi:hypothetical protein